MKRLLLILIGGLAIGLTGCLKDQCTETRTFVQFDPVYKTRAEMLRTPSMEMPRSLRNPGILYVYKQYILINEFREGIHVFDNSDPANPQNIAFLQIEGNEHFAISHNRLQANKFNALVTIDITDLQQPRQTSRIDNVFGELWEDPGRGFLVYHEATERTRTLDCSDPNFNAVRWEGNGRGGPVFWNVDFALSADQNAGAVRESSGGAGVGGSTARFTITKSHLYTVSQSDLTSYDLSNPSAPRFVSKSALGWGIETIYPFKDLLFIGSNTGMFIYNIADPVLPLLQSQFRHARACDPVVADDNTAYVTLREGTFCEGFANQLDVIDISQINSPSLIRSYDMKHPHGLSLQGDHLYICEGDFGLKAFDVTEPEDIKEIEHLDGLNAKDVIALTSDLLLVIGEDGFRQYDSSNPKKLEMISMIPIEKTP